MPANNCFQHQRYSPDPPGAEFQLIAPQQSDASGSEAEVILRHVGATLQTAQVRFILLVHGTFAGTDGLGVINQLQKIVPHATHLAGRVKATIDQVLTDSGNFTESYARRFEQAINPTEETQVEVQRVIWPGQNSHIGRAEGAIRLIHHILTVRDRCGPKDRILIWGHSHGGNVAALATNLLGGSLETRRLFFRATHDYAETVAHQVDRAIWQRVESFLLGDHNPNGIPLDIVTFGTPIRYGWESNGFGRLVHFVHHRPTHPHAQYLAAFPNSMEEFFKSPAGDYVHQFGIAGSNLFAGLFSRQVRQTEWRLKKLLQAEVRNREFVRSAMIGKRVADDGTTLLVDYSRADSKAALHSWGHSVYTRDEWLSFHAREVCRRFYSQGNF